MNAATEVTAYTQAVSSGQYARVTALRGKYDHVRLQWEDRSFQVMLQPHLADLMDRRAEQGAGLRVVDLGCGSGDGIETLLTIDRPDPPRAAGDIRLVPPDRLDQYTGLEMNPALLEQARARFADQPRTRFQQADLREGLGFDAGQKPYDLYSASFGTLSHFSEDQTVRLWSQIVRHAAPDALIVGDWLGRYSYEWTDLWREATGDEQWMDYRISYIYPPEERKSRQIDSFALRLLGDDDVQRICRRVGEETGATIEIRSLFDRSMLVGRHMDTADYNPHASPLRTHVNRLHERGVRTDLDALRFDLRLPEGFAEAAGALGELARCWNDLVEFTARLFDRWDRGAQPPDIPSSAPELLKAMMARMVEANRLADRLGYDDPRGDWLEGQLALCLRELEIGLQRGLGCGHGLVVIAAVRK